jgi:hypothetical protein
LAKVSATHDLRPRRPLEAWRPQLRAGAEFFRPLLKHWLVTVAIVGAALGTALLSSARVATRYEAVANVSLSRTTPGPRIQEIMSRRLRPVAAAVGLGLHNPEVRVLAQPGSSAVDVIASGPRAPQLPHVANVFAVELTAWELGRRRLQDRYRRLYAQVHRLSPGDPRLPGLTAELAVLQRRVVSAANYRAAASATRTAGPEPVRAGAVALVVGLLLALAVARALARDEERRTRRAGPAAC